MSLVLPAIRLSQVMERLRTEGGLSYEQRSLVMQIIEDEIEVGARRIGVMCPVEGCIRVVEDKRSEVRNGNSVFMWHECPEHGTVNDHGGLPLLIAFDPWRQR